MKTSKKRKSGMKREIRTFQSLCVSRTLEKWFNPYAESSCGETLLLRLIEGFNQPQRDKYTSDGKLSSAPKGRYTSAMGAAHRQRLQLSQAAKRRNTNLVESRANLQIAIFLSSSPLLRALFALICLIFFKVDSSH